MRPAFLICAAVLLAATSARAESWQHTRDNGGGYPMCFDKDSVTTKPDGLTYYAVKMCKDAVPQYYAVDCTKNFKVELLVRIYDVGSTTHFREITADYPQSGMALDADMACRK
ncbi:MAG: hypothetical protein WDN01_20005 [Rhizomicrobium sp.]